MRWSLLLFVILAGCGGVRPATSVCTIDGGAAPRTPLSLGVRFEMSGCAPSDAKCTASVDAGLIALATSATWCSTGTSPGGVTPAATCFLPPLEPGSYTISPFGETLVVNADGGATACTR
jgi:hypothetical protein